MKRRREGEETAPAAPASSSRDDGSRRGYDVFLSFRGPDTRLTIADSLYNAMDRAGICVFKDDQALLFGERIGGGLSRGIENSKIYIPIFSKGYASSKSCLRELAQMVECIKRSTEDDQKVILPIFYDVDADDVKLKTDLYGKALQNHKSDSRADLVKEWEEALREVGRILGKNLKDHGQDELINIMVEEVANLLWPRRTDVPDRLVGIKDSMDEIMKRLDLEAFDVRFIVIHGMGGIGKTTLAEAVFKHISPQFKGKLCFLRDVRTSDIIELQKKLLFDILNMSCKNLSFIDDGACMIKTRFRGKKVLIVLDDIDKWDQIMRLAGEPNWFGGGSRIIVTTRNIEFLVKEGEDDNGPASNRGQFSLYNMPEMNFHDALQLFCERAKPPPDCMDITNKLINALGGLPLALDVVGSTLLGKSRSRWEETLCKLKQLMNEDVKKKLMISYEALDSRQQTIFLDIACFFINQEKIAAIKYWDAVFECPTESEVKILTRMSLIKIRGNDKLWIHDQLRDLGRDIVHLESSDLCMRRSRLWSPKDAFHVVKKKTGTKKILMLNLGTPKPDASYKFEPEEFGSLVNLRFLQLDHGNFEGDFKGIFSELRWLSWSNCPSEFQATNFGLENLAVLELSGGNITQDWGGWRQIMVAKELKVLQLNDCPSLRKTPEFSAISQLERLILKCTQLRKIDKSIGNLQHLDYLEIECEALESLPESIGGLKSLTELRVKSDTLSVLPHPVGNLVKVKHLTLRCPKLQGLPDSIGQLESLLVLDVEDSKINKLPLSIGNLGRLEVLRIRHSKLEKLPNSIGRLQSLLELDLVYSKIRSLPDCIGDLKKLKILRLDGICLSEFPKTIGKLENLEVLYAYCKNMKREIPSEIGELSSLKILSLTNGRFRLPTTINRLTNLEEFNLWFCDLIGQLPEFPKSVTTLTLSCNSMTTTPDFSNLTNLGALRSLTLRVGEMTLPPTDLSSLSQLQRLTVHCADLRSLTRLPSSLQKLVLEKVQSPIDWSLFSNLENLSSLRIDGYSPGEIRFEVLEKLPPTDLSSLSQLQELTVHCAGLRSLTRLPSSLQRLDLEEVQSPIDWSLFSNLENLSSLRIDGYSPGEIRFEVLEKLQKFKRLAMYSCPLLKTLPVLPGLKEIRSLSLYRFHQLTEIQGLGELRSLRDLCIWDCNPIKSLNEYDLSNLQNLERLEFKWCKSLESVLGVRESSQLIVKDCPRLRDFEGPYRDWESDDSDSSMD